MKTLLLLLLCTASLSAQLSVIGTYQQHLYVGVNNRLRIEGADAKQAVLQIVSRQPCAQLRKDEAVFGWYVQCWREGEEQIAVGKKTETGVEWLDTLTFQVHRVPPLQAHINAPMSNSGTRYLKYATALEVVCEDEFGFTAPVRIYSYTVYYNEPNKDPVVFEVEGNAFPAELRTIIQQSGNDASFQFTDIRANTQYHSCSMNPVPSFVVANGKMR